MTRPANVLPYLPRLNGSLSGDLDECLRALRAATQAAIASGNRPFITARALACQLGWRYTRTEAALADLRARGHVLEGDGLWTVAPD